VERFEAANVRGLNFLLYDALKMRFRELKVPKDPDCPVCGKNVLRPSDSTATTCK